MIGNVQAQGARHVVVAYGSRVGGSVQVVQGGSASVANSRIDGDIQYNQNKAGLNAIRNRVGGSIQVFQNSGGVLIRGNIINGNLQCKSNNPRRLAAAILLAAKKRTSAPAFNA